MTTTLTSGLTVQQVIDAAKEILTLGLDVLDQEELVPLVDIAARIAEDGAALVTGPTATEVLTTEVDAEQAAGDAAERAKFPKG